MLPPTKSFFRWVSLFLVIQLCWAGDETDEGRNYQPNVHPCRRTCVKGDIKLCKYRWELNYGNAMDGNACGNCPITIEDCKNPRCIAADGTPRMIVSVNGMIPGPPLEVCHNDIIDVIVTNNLNCAESTTIHWHGIHMKNTPFMDGVPQITQCPIHPGSSFQYIFRATEPGTHLWHAHSGLQQADGVFGHIVIRQPLEDDPHANLYDSDLPEHVIMVHEWGKTASMNTFMHSMTSVASSSGGSSYAQDVQAQSQRNRVPNNGKPQHEDKPTRRQRRATGYEENYRDERNVRGVYSDYDRYDSRSYKNGASSSSSGSAYIDSSSGSASGGSSSGSANGGSYSDSVYGDSMAAIESLAAHQVTDVTLLVNGKGKGMDYGTNGRHLYTPVEVYDVYPNKRYCMRFIAQSFIAVPIEVSIAKHQLLIIRCDGRPIKPVLVSSFKANAGERFDFVFTANKKVGNYPMYIRGSKGGASSQARQIAMIHYSGAAPVKNTAALPSYLACIQRGPQLTSEYPDEVSGDVAVFKLESFEDNPNTHPESPPRHYFEIGHESIQDRWLTDPWTRPMDAQKNGSNWIMPQINKITLRHPSAPLLTQRENIQEWEMCSANNDTLSKCGKEYCECAHILELKKDEIVDIVLIGHYTPYNLSHPLHCHGYYFTIVAHHFVGDYVDRKIAKELLDSGKVTFNRKNGVMKDTVAVPSGGFVVVSLKADNPGYWLFHCHILYHHALGMGFVLQVGTESEIKEHLKNIPSDFPRCSNFLINKENLKM